ncbi:MAG: transglutaminase domain-containing protein [Solirubrobacterales bacterium]|nr:transglutaminase domain-containing protein [Solirubrobacterales bacterium]
MTLTLARLALFAAFAAFGTVIWSRLVAEPSAATTVGVVAVAVACAATLIALDRLVERRWLASLLALAAVVAAAAAALLVEGVPAALLAPWNWGDLAVQVDQALVGVQEVDWPYDGPDEWVRRTILIGAPLLTVVAAALAFWPAPEEARPGLRLSALGVLVALYAVAATTRDPGAPVPLGIALAALIAAWLWLPRLARRREGAIALVAVAAATLLAVPAASALDGEEAWLDYRSWSPFGPERGIAFDWSHQYGPLDWPRQGTTLLTIRSDRPHYWKAETLDGFDGTRWYRSGDSSRSDLASEMPFDSGAIMATPDDWDYGEPNSAWSSSIKVEVRSLSTDVVVGAGLTYDISGVPAVPAADGTVELLGDPLERGDQYQIRSYEPAPTPFELDAAPRELPGWVGRFLTVSVPAGDDDAEAVTVPAWGAAADAAEGDAREGRTRRLDPATGDDAEAGAELAGSDYARTYALARSLAGEADSPYEAVVAIETHLRETYAYDELVPVRDRPLEAFLFEDRRGYCQHFSGAMALMLRMVGVPARVAAGFSPGTHDPDTDQYRVRDLDAHSWVEVYFAGVGWVPFDPTPRAAEDEQTGEESEGAPATGGEEAAAGRVRSAEPEPVEEEPAEGDGADEQAEDDAPAATAASGPGGDGPGPPPAAALVALAGGGVLALAAAAAVARRGRRRRSLG